MLAMGSSSRGTMTSSPVTSLRRQSFHAVPPPSPLTRLSAAAAPCHAAMSTSPTVTGRGLSPLVGGQCLLAAGTGISNLSQSYSPAYHGAGGPGPAAGGPPRNSLSAVEPRLCAARRRSASPEALLNVNQRHHVT